MQDVINVCRVSADSSTTLIEDTISVNTPFIIRKTKITEHLVDGNGAFLKTDEYKELYSGMAFFEKSSMYEHRNKLLNNDVKAKLQIDFREK